MTMGQSTKINNDTVLNKNGDLLLGKKERSEEPKGFDLLRAADTLGFSKNEIEELNRLYKSDASEKPLGRRS